MFDDQDRPVGGLLYTCMHRRIRIHRNGCCNVPRSPMDGRCYTFQMKLADAQHRVEPVVIHRWQMSCTTRSLFTIKRSQLIDHELNCAALLALCCVNAHRPPDYEDDPNPTYTKRRSCSQCVQER